MPPYLTINEMVEQKEMNIIYIKNFPKILFFNKLKKNIKTVAGRGVCGMGKKGEDALP